MIPTPDRQLHYIAVINYTVGHWQLTQSSAVSSPRRLRDETKSWSLCKQPSSQAFPGALAVGYLCSMEKALITGDLKNFRSWNRTNVYFFLYHNTTLGNTQLYGFHSPNLSYICSTAHSLKCHRNINVVDWQKNLPCILK